MTEFKASRLTLLVLSLCTLRALPLHADDQPPAAAKIAVVARVAVGSPSQIYKLADELGIPLPAIITPSGIERMFTFLDQGGLNPDLPIALDYLGGGDLPDTRRTVFYLPVNAGHATLQDFLKSGEKMGDDGALVNGMPFRRTPDYLLFGGTPALITAIKPDEMVKQQADRPLLYVDFSAKVMREVMPDAWAKFEQNLTANAAKPKTQAEATGQKLVTDWFATGLDRLTLRLSKQPDFFRLTTQVQPGVRMTQSAWSLAGMPDGLAARIDYQLPDGSVDGVTHWLQKAIGDDQFFAGLPSATMANKEKFVAAISDAAEIILGGDQASCGIGASGGKFIVYIVAQSTKPRNVQQDWKRVKDEFKEFAGKEGKDGLQLSQYNVSNEQVSRATILENDGTPEFQIDSVDRGAMRFMTITEPQITAIDKLLASQASGTLNTAAAGWVDLKALMDLLPLMPKSKTSALSEDDQQLLNKVFGAQRISFGVKTDHDQFGLSMDIPIVLVKNAIANAPDLMRVAGNLRNKDGDK